MKPFHGAKIVRLQSQGHRYLIAGDDKESVKLDHNGSQENALWIVERSGNIIRFESCYGKYLTDSHERIPLGPSSYKVTQTASDRGPASTIDWEAIAVGDQVKLKAPNNQYLRGSGPWHYDVSTHSVPHNGTIQDFLWKIDVVKKTKFTRILDLAKKIAVPIGAGLSFASSLVGLVYCG